MYWDIWLLFYFWKWDSSFQNEIGILFLGAKHEDVS